MPSHANDVDGATPLVDAGGRRHRYGATQGREREPNRTEDLSHDHARRVGAGAMIGLAGGLFSFALATAYQIIVARKIGPAGFGVLALALAIASSFKSRPLRAGTLALGEVSLSGDLRRVPRIDARVREAAALGFARAGVPAVQASEAEGRGLEIVPLGTVREAFDSLLGERVAPLLEPRAGAEVAVAVGAEAGSGHGVAD